MTLRRRWEAEHLLVGVEGMPHLPLDEPVDHAAILIETPYLEGLV